jgi:hypothetical protein
MRTFGCFLLLLTALFTAACGTGDPRFRDDTIYVGSVRPPQAKARPSHDTVSYWDGDGVSGTPFVRICLSEQRAYFFKGGQLVGVSSIATGREGFDTPAGTFKIIQKNRHHKSNLYGDWVDASGRIIEKDIGVKTHPRPPGAIFDGARMPYFMRIHGGVGMHEGFLPGYPASHGCIRMPGFMAAKFFENVEKGTPVQVVN